MPSHSGEIFDGPWKGRQHSAAYSWFKVFVMTALVPRYEWQRVKTPDAKEYRYAWDDGATSGQPGWRLS